MIFRNLFLNALKIQRKIDYEVSRAKHAQRLKDELEKKKEMHDLSMRYEKLLAARNQKIKRLELQHEADLKAYQLYKDELYDLNEFFNKLEPGFKTLQNKFAEGISVFNQHKDQVDSLARITERKDSKVEKLLTKKIG